MTDLSVLVPSLKRALAVPGEFETVYPNTYDEDLTATLADGYAKAQLYGFFDTGTLDPIAGTVEPDLTPAEGMLVVLFSSIEVVRTRIRELRTRVAYRAGPTEYAAEQSASVLTQVLKDLEAQRNDLMALGGTLETFGYVNDWADGFMHQCGWTTSYLEPV